MADYTPQQMLADFETLADEKHHSEVFRASERIRLYVVTLEERLARARAEALQEAASIVTAPGWKTRRCDVAAEMIRSAIAEPTPATIPAGKVQGVLRDIYRTGEDRRGNYDQRSAQYAEHTGRMGAAFTAARDLELSLDAAEPNP